MRNFRIIIVAVLIAIALAVLLSPATLYSTRQSDSPVAEPKIEVVPVQVSTTTPKARKPQGVVVVKRPEAYVEIVQEKATEYEVSADLMIAIIDCENKSWTPTQQSGHFYKKARPAQGIEAGEQEKSYGLVQIHLPDHPKITYEQATNPTFSIEFLASELSAGRGRQWSCYSPALNKIAKPDSTGQHSLEEKPKADNLQQAVGTTSNHSQ